MNINLRIISIDLYLILRIKMAINKYSGIKKGTAV
jgi:hypothetical protein